MKATLPSSAPTSISLKTIAVGANTTQKNHKAIDVIMIYRQPSFASTEGARPREPAAHAPRGHGCHRPLLDQRCARRARAVALQRLWLLDPPARPRLPALPWQTAPATGVRP